jgi:hypothetical protein
LQPPADVQWNSLKCDKFLFAEGNKAFSLTSAELQSQGLKSFSNDYVLQYMDWITLGTTVNMSALQTKKRFLKLHAVYSRQNHQRSKVAPPQHHGSAK